MSGQPGRPVVVVYQTALSGRDSPGRGVVLLSYKNKRAQVSLTCVRCVQPFNCQIKLISKVHAQFHDHSWISEKKMKWLIELSFLKTVSFKTTIFFEIHRFFFSSKSWQIQFLNSISATVTSYVFVRTDCGDMVRINLIII